MTKKDFEAIAKDVKWQLGQAKTDDAKMALCSLAASMAVTFSIINPRFDRQRFMTACGLGDTL